MKNLEPLSFCRRNDIFFVKTTTVKTSIKMSWVENPGEHNELDMSKLDMDQAYLRVAIKEAKAYLFSLSNECVKCPYRKHVNLNETISNLIINVKYGQKWMISNEDKPTLPDDSSTDKFCKVSHDMGEFGVYALDEVKCTLTPEKEPVNIHLPLVIVFFCLLGIYAICKIGTYLKNKYFKVEIEDVLQEKAPARKRIRALDTFRGMSIVLMIFVNDGGGGYWWMGHTTWNGLTIPDFLFPFFLWIMGVCIPISVKSLISKNVPKYESLTNIFRRSCTLFLMGLALNTIFDNDVEKMRVFGVLQRFGISFFFTASMMVVMSRKWNGESENKFIAAFQDIIELGWQWLIMIVLLIIYLTIMFVVPAPGCDKGYFGPGGMHENFKHINCTGGIQNYIDTMTLSKQHLYQNAEIVKIYNAQPIDPEGVFGCLMSIFHVFFGVQAGNTMLHFQKPKQLIGRWLTWALITGLIGGALCEFTENDGAIPINKNLWSLSFVLVTTSISFALLSLCYVLIDVYKWWDGSPFIQPGMNSIVMYVGHMICNKMFPFHWSYEGMRTHFISTLESLWGMMLWILISYSMKKKKVFITI